MRLLLLVLLCLFFGFGVFGQSVETQEKIAVKVENIALMRDDGEGNPGAETENFKTTDFPVHCQITLDSVKPATVKMNLIAVSVNGLKAETKFLTVSYKTNGEQNIVNFRGAPQNLWLAGKYRVDIYVDDKPAGNKEFTIEKSGALSDGQNNFGQSKSKPRTKPKRKN